MPINLITHLKPINDNKFYLLEDNYLKGGYQVVGLLNDLDDIEEQNRKHGMLVFVAENETLWTLDSDLITWLPFVVDTKGTEFKVGMYVYVSPIEGIVDYCFVDDVYFEIDLDGSKAAAMTYETTGPVDIDMFKNRTDHIGQLTFHPDKTFTINTNGNRVSFIPGETITFSFPELNRMEGISITLKGSYKPLI